MGIFVVVCATCVLNEAVCVCLQSFVFVCGRSRIFVGGRGHLWLYVFVSSCFCLVLAVPWCSSSSGNNALYFSCCYWLDRGCSFKRACEKGVIQAFIVLSRRPIVWTD